MKLKKGDNVIVIAGKHKGVKGSIGKVIPETGRVIVSGVAKIKVHIKPKKSGEKGTTSEREMPIHASNVMLVGSNGKPTRTRAK